ncbi:4-amino-4-deoxychorismate synthase [Sugiyamaella lignohabitans]|uniref:aminodeoxychorismate synthase n=1 Tax=Sugiyamaella lignohabitans TaxID=796027 RepID=A0A161HJB5_9ASCO|nr:4-amino-4-deoxychorismate synthase [Sugiyamaella lignohabitans]ANB12797.1 4-amino-4-deoxychorismate synthase [Sugiyamaella lignohabitans]
MARILLIDSYDSFTFNLSTLIEKVTGATVITIRNDAIGSDELINDILPLFDAVVVGPGPGSPDNPDDIGVLDSLWKLTDEHVLPIFGVCLGFQSMVLGFGGSIHRLKVIKHGQPGKIQHSGESIFKGLPQGFSSIRYHSLHARISDKDNLPNGTTNGHVNGNTTSNGTRAGSGRDTSGSITPLAWLISTEDDHAERVLMAGKHLSKPFYGVQYHPESICSEYGAEVLMNFWLEAQKWSSEHGRVASQDEAKFNIMKSHYSIKPEPLTTGDLSSTTSPVQVPYKKLQLRPLVNSDSPSSTYIGADIICDELLETGNFVLLNSASEPGRWSIIGVLQPGKTNTITHYTSQSPQYAYITKWKETERSPIDLATYGSHKDGGDTNSHPSVWNFLAHYMSPKIAIYKQATTPPNAPFIGGLVGYFTYEASSLNMIPEKKPLPVSQENQTNAADVSLVDVERTILIDNQTHVLYTVSLLPGDDEWLTTTIEKIDNLQKQSGPFTSTITPLELPANPTVTMPDKEKYIAKIRASQEYLKSGDSYELCLTAQTKIEYKEVVDPWNLYKILLKRNPAPYSCFLDLPDSILVGSSPERFMSWNRQGMCEFRPIKGTVKKSPDMTRAKAEAILNTPKELGENLMIVDLIRHDLNQILHNVRADKLMSVEEYKSVYQLVSVIQGDLPNEYLGIDVLSHSLPPGSMTGAPKLRSVEILHHLEDQVPRGIYSGVSGYWSVQDEGDWSVIIRSTYMYKADLHTWRIGAGGAITILSDPEAEWDEMQTKLNTALQAFREV